MSLAETLDDAIDASVDNGLESNGQLHGEQVTAEGWCAFGRWHPHNQYLFLWMENGLPGLIAFLVLVGAPVWAARRAQPHQRRLLLSFAVILAVNSLINASLWSSRESHFFVMLLIVLCADALYGGAQRPAQTPRAAD